MAQEADDLEQHPGVPPQFKSQYIVHLQGKPYPTWPGILDLAHESGLVELSVTLLQYPTPENGSTAVCQASATFEGGKRFTDVGDANPSNVNARIATALIRMASTRAKGRCLRDALNIGVVLAEELPMEEHAPRSTHPTDGSPPACSICGTVLTLGQAQLSMRGWNRLLCPSHQQTTDRRP